MSSDSNSVSVSSNSVTVTCPMIKSMKYLVDTLGITPLQPIRSLPKITQSGEQPHTWTITLECGVQPSSEVANSFNKFAGGGAHEYSAASGGNGEPTEMDFYFEVEITMLRELIPVRLWFGQSGSGDTISWWVGGDLIINHREPLLLVITEDYHHVKVLALSGTNDSFTMTPVSS